MSRDDALLSGFVYLKTKWILYRLVSRRIILIKSTCFVTRLVFCNQHIYKVIHATDSLENWKAIVTDTFHIMRELMEWRWVRSLASESLWPQTTTLDLPLTLELSKDLSCVSSFLNDVVVKLPFKSLLI